MAYYIIICIGFLRDVLGQQVLFKWWHGKGGLIDYTNKEALEWWHSQMDKVIYIIHYKSFEGKNFHGLAKILFM